MKLIFKQAFLVFVVLFVAACASVSTELTAEKKEDHGLLWKIEHPGSQASYLFGTIHSEDPRVLTLPPQVQKAFDQSHDLALEIEFSPDTGQYAYASMFFNDGRTLKALLDDQTVNRVIKVMSKHGVPEHQVLNMKPWAVFTLMNMPEPETGIYLDIKLYQMALSQGKGLHGLETIEEQIATFDDMTITDQVRYLKHALEYETEFEAVLDQTIDVYLSRDLLAIESLNEEFMAEMPEDLARQFVYRLIDHRNQRMFERMQPMLESGNVFIAVGALHLPGKSGIINKLRESGHVVTAVY